MRRGDTLWSIAATVVGDDPGAIASYWPRIHSANRAVVGDDPDVIVPGQRLVLPAWRS
ncbi:MAG TPA: LysM peptidoglycan-binding domain-containing protein [Actinomycetota bacterium]|nr:LysM peptidoglycan-binding domain-containing protein [Actinomycetota bacterium]